MDARRGQAAALPGEGFRHASARESGLALRVLSRLCGSLSGALTVPGDKSVSHRAVLLGAAAVGSTTITNLLESEDVVASIAAIERLGAQVERNGETWTIRGVGPAGFREPDDVLDMGNSGTGVRLLMGLVAGCPFSTFFSGDASLRQRPMRRVITPLTMMGASFVARSGDRLPLVVNGSDDLVPVSYTSPVASAQVKSAVLLAALGAPGTTTVIEPQPTRDHTERMLRQFGAVVRSHQLEDGRVEVEVAGQAELTAQAVRVPGDFSSAAFLIVAAVLVPGSAIVLRSVGVNPLRTGLIEVLERMGASIRLTNAGSEGAEPVADIEVRSSQLGGVDVPEHVVPSMIDEFPILSIAAACAEGVTTMSGLGELRVKESDRLSAVAQGLRACGVQVDEGDDWMRVTGSPSPKGGGDIAARLDHRIAMAFTVLGAVSAEPVIVDDASSIATSFPGFIDAGNGLGMRMETEVTHA